VKVFVTGGTGLVGTPIVRMLVHRGIEVTALVRGDRGADRMRELGATPRLGVVEDPRTWEDLGAHEGVIHSAALVAARRPWQNFFQVNVEGTRLAAATARRLGARLVHISSVAVYGRSAADDPEGSRNEAAPLGALAEHDYYARSKRLAEEMVRAEVAIGLEAVILRPCVIYGEDDRLFLPRLSAVARLGWLPRVGAGDRPMALVHADSVADAAVRALVTPQAASRIYLVANDDDITPREFVAALSDGLGRSIRSVPVPAPAALALARGAEAVLRVLGPGLYPGTLSGAVRFWRGGNPYTSARARAELGWAPRVRHREAIAELVRRSARAGSRD
jgi:nucleoside-diphosphate-sugar epimerase